MEIREIKDAGTAAAFAEAFLRRGVRIPMLVTGEQLRANLTSCISSPDDIVLGVYDRELCGVFSFAVAPEEKYVEMLAALSDDASACRTVLRFMKERFSGYTFDAVFHPGHRAVKDALRDLGAQFYPVQLRLRLVEYAPFPHAHTVVAFEEKYHSQYDEIHEKDCYWTAERVLGAPEIFRVLVAVEDGEVVGYADFTYKHEENEIYDLFVKEPHRGRGVGGALLDGVLQRIGSGVIAAADEDNTAAIRMLHRAGFETAAGEESATASLIF